MSGGLAMPEGDTIFRSAKTLRNVLVDQAIRAARTSVPQVRNVGVERLVGQTVAAVESRGKHLLIWFAPSDLALHTHMGMTGSWHVYPVGRSWRKPAAWAKVVLEAGEVVAVCFSAPVCALLSRAQVACQPSLARLGPDALAADVDLGEARRRLAARGEQPIGEALLDQSVLAGVGNVYKSEVLFLNNLDPWTPASEISGERQAALLEAAVRLLRANAGPQARPRITTGAPPGGPRLYVYGRARRPCRRCSAPIRVARQGEQARLTYWCPRCQGPGRPR